MRERRVHPRYEIGFGAEVHVGSAVIGASTKDVSRGGCRIASDTPLPEGGPYRIELKLTVDGIQEEDYPPLIVAGSVRWTAEGEDDAGIVYMSGIQFDGMSEQQAVWLEAVLAKHGTGT